MQEVRESGRTKDLAWRRSQLRGLLRLLTEKEDDIFGVLHDDLGKHRAESYRDEVREIRGHAWDFVKLFIFCPFW